MWKRKKEELPDLFNPDKTVKLERWNHFWDPPGELSNFYTWDDDELKWVEIGPPTPKSHSLEFQNVDKKIRWTDSTEDFVPDDVLKGVKSIGKFKERELELRDRVKKLDKKLESLTSTQVTYASLLRDDAFRIRLNLALNRRPNLRDLQHVPDRFGHHTLSSGEQRIHFDGVTVSVKRIQQKINGSLGIPRLFESGSLDIDTMHALNQLDKALKGT